MVGEQNFNTLWKQWFHSCLWTLKCVCILCLCASLALVPPFWSHFDVLVSSLLQYQRCVFFVFRILVGKSWGCRRLWVSFPCLWTFHLESILCSRDFNIGMFLLYTFASGWGVRFFFGLNKTCLGKRQVEVDDGVSHY